MIVSYQLVFGKINAPVASCERLEGTISIVPTSLGPAIVFRHLLRRRFSPSDGWTSLHQDDDSVCLHFCAWVD